MFEDDPHLTQAINDWSQHDNLAPDLAEKLYAALERQAHRLLAQDHRATFNTRELVNEAALEVLGQKALEYQGRAHFFGTAALCMRRILIVHARKRGADKRAHIKVTYEEAPGAVNQPVDALWIQEMLEQLDNNHWKQMIQMRYLVGLTVQETAELMEVTTTTIMRWQKAAFDQFAQKK